MAENRFYLDREALVVLVTELLTKLKAKIAEASNSSSSAESELTERIAQLENALQHYVYKDEVPVEGSNEAYGKDETIYGDKYFYDNIKVDDFSYIRGKYITGYEGEEIGLVEYIQDLLASPDTTLVHTINDETISGEKHFTDRVEIIDSTLQILGQNGYLQGSTSDFSWILDGEGTSLQSILNDIPNNAVDTETNQSIGGEKIITGKIILSGTGFSKIEDSQGNKLSTLLGTLSTDTSIVHIEGAETILGAKTFSGNTTFNETVTFNDDVNIQTGKTISSELADWSWIVNDNWSLQDYLIDLKGSVLPAVKKNNNLYEVQKNVQFSWDVSFEGDIYLGGSFITDSGSIIGGRNSNGFDFIINSDDETLQSVLDKCLKSDVSGNVEINGKLYGKDTYDFSYITDGYDTNLQDVINTILSRIEEVNNNNANIIYWNIPFTIEEDQDEIEYHFDFSAYRLTDFLQYCNNGKLIFLKAVNQDPGLSVGEDTILFTNFMNEVDHGFISIGGFDEGANLKVHIISFAFSPNYPYITPSHFIKYIRNEGSSSFEIPTGGIPENYLSQSIINKLNQIQNKVSKSGDTMTGTLTMQSISEGDLEDNVFTIIKGGDIKFKVGNNITPFHIELQEQGDDYNPSFTMFDNRDSKLIFDPSYIGFYNKNNGKLITKVGDSEIRIGTHNGDNTSLLTGTYINSNGILLKENNSGVLSIYRTGISSPKITCGTSTLQNDSLTIGSSNQIALNPTKISAPKFVNTQYNSSDYILLGDGSVITKGSLLNSVQSALSFVSSEVETRDGVSCLILTFEDSSHQEQEVVIPTSSFFDSNNYYTIAQTKSAIDIALSVFIPGIIEEGQQNPDTNWTTHPNYIPNGAAVKQYINHIINTQSSNWDTIKSISLNGTPLTIDANKNVDIVISNDNQGGESEGGISQLTLWGNTVNTSTTSTNGNIEFDLIRLDASTNNKTLVIEDKNVSPQQITVKIKGNLEVEGTINANGTVTSRNNIIAYGDTSAAATGKMYLDADHYFFLDEGVLKYSDNGTVKTVNLT